jgi:glycosyltransferase involved in cell wall biosynthesis
MSKNLSVIISFKNEEENIGELIERIQKTLDENNISYEIIFVDDKSSDNSKKIIIEKIKQDQNIKYILLSRTFGIGPGIIAGLENTQTEASVYIDCDLQDPPELIPKMYNLFKEGNDGWKSKIN